MSPDPVLPGLFLPCSLPRLLRDCAGGGLEPSPVRRFRGASPHRLLSYAKESSVAASFAHGTLSHNGATNHEFAVTRVTLRIGKPAAQSRIRKESVACLRYDLLV